MQFEGYRRTSHIPNLTPLIDIVFLLLIFFMLTSHFVREDTIKIELPESNTGVQLKDDQQIEVLLDNSGLYFFENNPLSADQLEVVLRERLLLQDNKVVRIKGDRASNLGSTVELIDLSRKAGARGIDIVTEKHESK